MPLIQITLTGPQAAPATIQQLQQETTRLMASILHKEAALTVVSVSQLEAGAYRGQRQPVGGRRLLGQWAGRYHLRQPAGLDHRWHQ
jgi:phenylpyruvate tautomerase PptA (4-oxalocrotonate tautomerase family)